MADVLFGDVDWVTLNATLNALATTDEKVAFIAKNYPGLASIVLMANFRGRDDILRQIQQANKRIAGTASRVPGANHQVAFQPQIAYESLVEALFMNSPLLTRSTLNQIMRERQSLHAGGRCYVLIQPCFTRNGHARSVHADAVYVPNDKRDGDAWFITTFIDPKERGDNETVQNAVKRLYQDRNLSYASPRPPTGDFETMQSSTPPNAKLGQYGLAEADWLKNDHHMFEHVMSCISGKPATVVYHTMGVIEISLEKEHLREAMIARDVILKSHALGTIATLGAHCGVNSCGHCVMGLFTLGSMAGGADQRALPLDQILGVLIDKAENVYWTNTKNFRPRDFFDLDEPIPAVSKQNTIPLVSKTKIKATLDDIFSHKSITASINSERPSYASQYLRCDTLPDAEGVQQAFQTVAQIHLAYLEKKSAKGRIAKLVGNYVFAFLSFTALYFGWIHW